MKIRAGIEISPTTGIIIGSVLLLIGILIAGFKADAIMLGLRSSSWPQATALITEANYWTTTSQSSWHQGRGVSGSSITYHGDYRYTFSVGGRTYQGSNFDVAGHMHTGIKRRGERIQSIFTKGAVVPVFHDPADPARCILKTGIAEDTQVAIVFSAFFAGVGAIVLRYQIKRLRNAG